MVLPPGPLSVPETQVLLQPMLPRAQEHRKNKADAVRERRELLCRPMEETTRNYVRPARAGQRELCSAAGLKPWELAEDLGGW
jgi:hypothetical protein